MKLRNIGITVLISAFAQSAFAQSFENAIYVKMEKFNRMTSSASRILGEGKDLLSVERSLQVEKVMVGDWIKVTMPSARSAEDLLAASRRLKSIPGVAAVDLPRKKKLFALTPSSFNDPGWASQLINFSGNGSSATRANLRVSPQFDLVLEKYASRSNELVMAVIDSGLNPSLDFEGRILSQRDYIERTNSIPSNDASPNGESCEFDPGLHGSHVASVMGAAANNNYGALGLAPNAKFHVARIFDCNGGFSFSGYLDELERLSLLEEDRPSVVNLSFGDVVSFTGAYPACSSIEQDAITLAMEAGIIVVASSGNDGSFANGRSLPAPASCDGVVSVGAVDNGGKYTSYSTVAPQLDIATFGGGTSDNRSFEAVNVTDPFENNNFALGTTQGTSFSSPAVATILAYARLLDSTIDTPTAVNMMQSTAYRATNETDSRCAGTNCYSLKAANFLALVEGVELPGPVSDLPGDPNPDPTPEPEPEPTPEPEPEPTPEPEPEPTPEPEPEPTPEPEVPEQPVTGRVTVQVEAGNFAGGFEDICSIVVTENDQISVAVNGMSDRCGQTAQQTRSPFANQTVSVTGPVGAIFSAQVVGFKPNESNQSVLVSRLKLNQNSVTPVVAESQDGAPAVSGGGGGSMSIYGLLGIALLMSAFRKKVHRA